jgi:spore coat protein A
MRRRTVLSLAGGAGLAALTGGCGTTADGPGTGALLTSGLPLPPAFTTPLPIPPTARPVRTVGGTDHYLLTQREASVRLLPGVDTTIWGYDGVFPGPTFRARSGRPMVVTVRNELPVPTSTHLHGGVTPAESDGFPTDLIVPTGYAPAPSHAHGASTGHVPTLHHGSRDYRYPMTQRAGTLWYHDHRMDFTAPQVWRGLAGMFIVTDEVDDALPLPRDDRDIPLMICDRSFDADGQLSYPSKGNRPGARDEFMAGLFGDVILVNGAPWPRHEVANVRHRLRLVNGSNARHYRLALRGPVPGHFVQVGSDGGLLAAPVTHTELPIAAGERFDVVVDFAAYPVGSEVTLVNLDGTGSTADVMKFVVTRTATDDTRVPPVLASVPLLDRADAVVTRTFDFRTQGGHWTINGEAYDPGDALATPRIDTVELWRFTSDFHHPIHVHLGHFQVLSRTGRNPSPTDGGWKDTVDVHPYEVVEVLVRFSGHRGRYMMHCHNLEHEDMAMMANFDVV